MKKGNPPGNVPRELTEAFSLPYKWGSLGNAPDSQTEDSRQIAGRLIEHSSRGNLSVANLGERGVFHVRRCGFRSLLTNPL